MNNANVIIVRFEELSRVPAALDEQRALVVNTLIQLRAQADVLRTGWVGDSADVFFAKMDNDVLLGLERMAAALGHACDAFAEAIHIYDKAEQQAAEACVFEHSPHEGDLAWRNIFAARWLASAQSDALLVFAEREMSYGGSLYLYSLAKLTFGHLLNGTYFTASQLTYALQNAQPVDPFPPVPDWDPREKHEYGGLSSLWTLVYERRGMYLSSSVNIDVASVIAALRLRRLYLSWRDWSVIIARIFAGSSWRVAISLLFGINLYSSTALQDAISGVPGAVGLIAADRPSVRASLVSMFPHLARGLQRLLFGPLPILIRGGIAIGDAFTLNSSLTHEDMIVHHVTGEVMEDYRGQIE